MRISFVPAVLFLVLLGAIIGVRALRASGRQEGVINTRDGIAIEGYDPVAYFTDETATPGDPAYRYEWSGAVWHFSSEEHRDMFADDPTRYAPAYGGYCAWAVSGNSLAGVDPEEWYIRDGRLFLNYNRRLNRRFVSDASERIRRADEYWPALERQLAE